ncbi:Glyoxalase-like domain protein [Pigmentiphaga humi]|uniref:Glyoxalase-like domain protein n=1 Tax=Pigmentiphaga humi TaxID=2478468 RepID=A0A3P4B6I1_9BURK|nr:VOC family protein [Pigmentiphaga humi]VCU71897.1 Glyoxalase-like domain protein [Pigmentiphaga humi]
MTQQDIHSVNHVGLVARDLAAAADRYQRMGFVLTPFSAHAGAWKPGAAVSPLGSGNRCVMFEQNYLEILGSEHAAAPSPRLEQYLRHHQGGHIICFGSEDLSSVDRRLKACGMGSSGVIPLQRDVETPEGVRTARFERVQFSPDDSPEGYIQAARHLTPEFIYQPRYARHPNGCTELSDTVLIVDDVARFRERYEHFTGLEPTVEAGEVTYRFPLCSRLTLLGRDRALERLPGTLHPPVPGIAAVGFRCPDLRTQADLLRSAGVPFLEAGGRLIVPAEEAAGVAVIFEA